MMSPTLPSPQSNESFSNSRLLSGVELLLGTFIVIGHNVFRVVPNEVLILFVLGLLSVRLRDGVWWSAIGLKRPDSWSRVLLIALGAAFLRIVLGEFVIEPIATKFWHPIVAPSQASEITGNIKFALLAFVIVWAFAAFGEEIVYRGYLLLRAADLGKRSVAAYWIGMIFVSILFGYGHYYKGPTGIIDSGVAGFILGTAFILSGRNLWASVLAHGLIDTYGIVVLYFGLAS